MNVQTACHHISPTYVARVISESHAGKTFTMVLADNTRVTCKVNTDEEISGSLPVVALFVPKGERFKRIPLAVISSFTLAGKSYKVDLPAAPKGPRGRPRVAR